jgi:cytosine/adenosine deaminase-related metal-dependent hydrolase
VPGSSTTVEVDAISCGPDGLDRPYGPTAWAIDLAHGQVTTVREGPPREGRFRVALPALVDAHDHGRGLGTQQQGIRDAPLRPWIDDLIAKTRPGSQYRQVHTALARLRAAGVGGAVVCVNPTTGDRATEVREAARAVRDSGLRAGLAFPISTGSAASYRTDRTSSAATRGRAERGLDEVDRVAEEIGTDGIDVLYHPVGPQWVDEDVLVAVAERSRQTGRTVHLHLLETSEQREWADRVYPGGLLVALDQMGLLTDRTWLAHGTHLRPDELTLLARRRCGLVLNVSSNFRLSSGLPPVAMAALAGVRLAAGLDGMTLEDDLDMWGELRLLRGLWQAQDRQAVAAAAVLAAGSSTAAASLGRAAPGCLRPGSIADFVVHDLGAWVHLAGHPDWSPAELALAGASTATTAEVWCQGQRVFHREASS